jgi:glycerol-3-phosphate dehydrogenase (NAD(P)+)
MSRIAVIGAGAWGTALSIILGRKGVHQIRLWVREPELNHAIRANRLNERFLPGQPIPESVSPTDNLEDALNGAEIVVSAVPSQHCRQVCDAMLPHLDREIPFVSATKGLEEASLLRMTEVLHEVLAGLQPRVGALSGPSFAIEAARGDPTAVTIASQDSALAESIQQAFSDPRFRVYRNDDVIGVEIGGALKNVIAIAAGICDGLGFGHNSIAALITRGLAEITRLALACGARAETMAGLAGLGDLVLTCTGGLSRNRSVGVELGRGRQLPEIIGAMHGAVAEGVFTTAAALGLARKNGIEMPITAQVDAILHRGKPPKDAIHELMTRAAKSEI